MKTKNSRVSLAGRRGELLAELFFEELAPVFISRPPTEGVGYDLLVGFSNDKAGVNTFAVEVKTTERPPADLRFPISRGDFNRMTHSNVPGLLLVADVKRNQLYYAWLTRSTVNVWLRPRTVNGGGNTISIPVIEIDEKVKRKLKTQLKSTSEAETTAGAAS